MDKKSASIIPQFDLEKSSVENFNQYIKYMMAETDFENVKRCRWAYEQYLKACYQYERELKKLEKLQGQQEEIAFVVGE